MWVWLSIAPGRTKQPVASITSASTFSNVPTPAIVSPSTSTSALDVPAALTTVPPRMIFLIASLPELARRDQVDRVTHGLRIRPDRQLEVLDRRVLLLRVADPVRGGREEHDGGDEARHLRGVVQRAGRERVVGPAHRLAGCAGGRDQIRVER